MANIVPDSFKTGLFKGTFNFDTSGNGGNAFKLALYTSISSYSASSTVYLAGTSNGEVSSVGTNYTAGGNALTNLGVNAEARNVYFWADSRRNTDSIINHDNDSRVTQFFSTDTGVYFSYDNYLFVFSNHNFSGVAG